MKRPENGTDSLDPEVERELEAIDRALAGEPVDPDLAGLATLAEELREERPEAREEWAAALDAEARGGFGRRRRSLRGLGSGVRIRSLLLPAGAVAATVAVVAVAVSVPSGSDDEVGGGSAATLEAPAAEDAPAAPEAAAPEALEREGMRAGGATDATIAPQPGGDALGAQKRRQDRAATLALKTSTERVREVSDSAVQITETAGGVVRSQNLQERSESAAATLELAVPTRELDSVLDQLTDLATVQSLNESAIDITRPFVSARDRLRDARAERRELLKALGNASGEQETEAIRKQLRDVRREISRAEAAFDNVARRARTSTIALTVRGTPDGEDDGNWSLGDAADDALSALKTVAGVLLIAAAILAPIALLAGLVWLVAARVRRARRERALDEAE